MNIDDSEFFVLQLDGFLNGLRCVIGFESRVFAAGLRIKGKGGLDEVVQDVVSEMEFPDRIKSRKHMDFNEIKDLLNKHIYKYIGFLSENELKNLDWNLMEYYGLISTAENRGAWNRLVDQGAYVIEYNLEKDCVIYFVEFENFVVITLL